MGIQIPHKPREKDVLDKLQQGFAIANQALGMGLAIPEFLAKKKKRKADEAYREEQGNRADTQLSVSIAKDFIKDPLGEFTFRDETYSPRPDAAASKWADEKREIELKAKDSKFKAYQVHEKDGIKTFTMLPGFIHKDKIDAEKNTFAIETATEYDRMKDVVSSGRGQFNINLAGDKFSKGIEEAAKQQEKKLDTQVNKMFSASTQWGKDISSSSKIRHFLDHKSGTADNEVRAALAKFFDSGRLTNEDIERYAQLGLKGNVRTWKNWVLNTNNPIFIPEYRAVLKDLAADLYKHAKFEAWSETIKQVYRDRSIFGSEFAAQWEVTKSRELGEDIWKAIIEFGGGAGFMSGDKYAEPSEHYRSPQMKKAILTTFKDRYFKDL